MFDIQLEVNGHSLRLGMAISDCRLYLSGKRTSRVGFLHRIIMRIVRKDEAVYFSKNCTIGCFNNKLAIIPNLSSTAGADEMYATSGYIFFKGGFISKIYIQVLDNRKYAAIFFEKFRSICENIYGQGKFEENSNVLNESWIDDKSALNVGCISKYGNMYFNLAIKQ
jgi:hypothetical protein